MTSADRRVALVTGVGRRAGIGAAVALRLAETGWDVSFTYWTPHDERMPWGGDAAAAPLLTAETLRRQRPRDLAAHQGVRVEVPRRPR